MKRKWLALVCLVMIVCLLPLNGMAIRRGDVVRITNANAVNVRKGPGTGYSVIGEAQPENTYVYLGTENGWHRIIFTGDTEGYVSGNRTAIEEGLVPDYVGSGEKVEAIVRVTHGNALNVRKGPGKTYGSMGTAKPNSEWTYLGMDDGWNIIDYNGKTGYIAANRTEVEVVDVIAGATSSSSSTEACFACGGSGVCTTCDGAYYIYHAAKREHVACISCGATGSCYACGGDGYQ